MDQKLFKEVTDRLQQVATVIAKLPAEIRAQAFVLLQPYVTAAPKTPADLTTKKSLPTGGAPPLPPADPSDKEAFFESVQHDKPADNTRQIAAYLYGIYGSEPFSVDEVRTLADDVGITVPTRIDKTLSVAKEKGKKLFARAAGKGMFKPTVHGENYLKTTYNVKKGTKKRQVPAK